MDDEDGKRLNRAWWDERVALHLAGEYPGRDYRARILLLRALCSTSARPSSSRTGGT
jgi:hypothetical protein